MSTFAYAGVSKLNGKFKARFANDQLRVKVLAKNGHKDIDIVQLKHPMTKLEAVEYLLSIKFDNGNTEVRAALEAAKESRDEVQGANKQPKKTKEAKKPAKAPAKKKSTPSMDAIKARAAQVKATTEAAAKAAVEAELEDAPF